METIIIDISSADSKTLTFHEMASVLSKEEKERARQFNHTGGMFRYVFARHRLRRILADKLETNPEHVKFDFGAFGKPYLADHPELHFNMSHSGSVVCIATAIGSPVGVDVERVREVKRCESLYEDVCSPSERSALRRLAEPLRSETFLLYWTKKEAFLKATGAGLAGLDSVAPGVPQGYEMDRKWLSHEQVSYALNDLKATYWFSLSWLSCAERTYSPRTAANHPNLSLSRLN